MGWKCLVISVPVIGLVYCGVGPSTYDLTTELEVFFDSFLGNRRDHFVYGPGQWDHSLGAHKQWSLAIVDSKNLFIYYTHYSKYLTRSDKITLLSEFRADSRIVPSQWEMALLCNNVSHWLGANLESALELIHCSLVTIELGQHGSMRTPTWTNVG